MSTDNNFTKNNLEKYIRELANEYKKMSTSDKMAKLILVGGASILLSYDFRTSTNDIDAIIYSSKEMLNAIEKIAERNNLPYNWINTDFESSPSYSDKLDEVAKDYKIFDNKLCVKIIDSEYLVAMKLVAGRTYKHDLSDIAGILWEHKKNNNPIKLSDIKKAAEHLYGSWERISEKSRNMIEEIFKENDYEKIYYENINKESEMQKEISKFKEEYPDAIKNMEDFQNVVAHLNKKI